MRVVHRELRGRGRPELSMTAQSVEAADRFYAKSGSAIAIFTVEQCRLEIGAQALVPRHKRRAHCQTRVSSRSGKRVLFMAAPVVAGY